MTGIRVADSTSRPLSRACPAMIDFLQDRQQFLRAQVNRTKSAAERRREAEKAERDRSGSHHSDSSYSLASHPSGAGSDFGASGLRGHEKHSKPRTRDPFRAASSLRSHAGPTHSAGGAYEHTHTHTHTLNRPPPSHTVPPYCAAVGGWPLQVPSVAAHSHTVSRHRLLSCAAAAVTTWRHTRGTATVRPEPPCRQWPPLRSPSTISTCHRRQRCRRTPARLP